MPESRVILDMGPLVAFLVESDQFHPWAVEQFRILPAPFLTCEAVLAETFHLLSRFRQGPRRFFDFLSSDLLVIDFDALAQRKSLAKLVEKYRDLPMSLADACLVRMTELTPRAAVFTLDNHFRIYRRNGRQVIATILPPGR